MLIFQQVSENYFSKTVRSIEYGELKEKPREFLVATRLTDEEFQALLLTFEKCYQLSITDRAEADKKEKTTSGRRRQTRQNWQL